MTDVPVLSSAEKQAAYERMRAEWTRGATKIPLRTYVVTLPDGREVTERCIGLSQVAARWPDARRVVWVGEGVKAFW